MTEAANRATSWPRVGVFVLLAFGFSWAIWEGLAAGGWRPGGVESVAVVLAGAFGPALAAVVVRLVFREGFVDAGLHPRLGKWPYYLAALFWPIPVVVFVVAATMLLGVGEVDLSFRSGMATLLEASEAEVPAGDIGLANLALLTIGDTLIGVFILFGEEFGWRGWLQRRLFPGRFGLAALGTGVIWSLWHLPVNLRGYNFPGHPVEGVAVFTVSCVLLSVIYGWFMARTGSVWVACLAHAATNAIGGVWVLMAIPDRTNELFTGFLGMLAWVPLGLIAGLCLWDMTRRRTGEATWTS
jgi:membrane protease YdiL (CAAX protease family)